MTDTGVGIEAAELPHIFERFYRGSRANEARGSGSGLGLAIVRSIVDMHGGTVEVESSVGRGSRFIVTLPRDPRLVEGTPAAERAAVASAADAPAGSERARPADPRWPIANVQETSPSERPQVNPGTGTLRPTPDPSSVATRAQPARNLPALCTTTRAPTPPRRRRA